MRSFVISTKYKADATQFVKEQSRMGRSFGSFARQMADGNSFVGRSFGKMNQAINNVVKVGFAALAGATIGSIALAKKSSDLWDIQAEAIKNVEATLQSTGGTVGRTLAQIEAGASSLQNKTFFGDEAILNKVSAQLLTFTNITGNTFDRTSAVVLDVTAKLRGLNASETDLQATSIMLGKALNDPVANLGALSRAGIQFSASQKETISKLWKAGKQAQAQALILSELEKQYGGTAAALASTTKGMEIQLGNLRGDLLETIGKGIEPMRLKFLQLQKAAIEKITPWIERLSSNLLKNSGAFDSLINNVAQFIDTKLDMFLEKVFNFVENADFSKMFKFGENLFKVFKFIGSHWRLLLALAAGIKAVAITMGILNILTSVFNVTLAASPVGMIITLVALLTTAIIWAVLNWDKIVAVLKIAWEWIKSVGIAIKDFAVSAWDFLITKLIHGVGWFKETWQQLSFLAGPLGILASMIGEVAKQWDKIKTAFSEKGIGAGIMAIGSALVSGLLIPLQSLLELAAKIPGLGGLAAGGAEKIQELRNSLMGNDIAAIGGAQTPTPEFPRGAAARSGGAGRIDININNQAGENADIKQSGNMPTGTRVNFAPAVSY